MVNASEKGRRKEVECMREVDESILKVTPEADLIASWHTYRSRAGGNDFLSRNEEGKEIVTGFDCALYYKHSISGNSTLMLIQVDDTFDTERYENLMQNWANITTAHLKICYAVYNHKPKIYNEVLDGKTQHFWILNICRERNKVEKNVK